jgi:membrane protein YdbS with pleckstrin-like domain
MSEHTELRPSPKYQVQLWVTIAAIFVFLILPFVFLGFAPGLGLLYVLIFALANALWLVPAIILVPIYCRSVRYVLRESDVVVQRGILIRAEDVVPYSMITNVAVRRGPVERLLGLGTLHLHTAGYSQQAGAEAKLVGLQEWDRIHAQLLELIHQHQRKEGVATSVAAEAASAGEHAESVPTLLGEILIELRQIRSELRDEDRT